MKTYLQQQFKTIFKHESTAVYFSPGRVNLIGEHVDYNGGFVFPCALSFGTFGALSKRDDLTVSLFSDGFSKAIYSFSLSAIKKDKNEDWADYVKGVIDVMIKRGYKITHGFNLYIKGTMPAGAGLSSSASLESLIVTLLDDMFALNIKVEDKALIGKETENTFIGVSSGIMDQFAVLAGKKDHAILLNTETLFYQYIPLILGDYQLLVINSNKQRGLADSKYNERFSECQTAYALLKDRYNVANLCSIPTDHLVEIKTLLDPVLFKRVSHVITEQERTIKATQALQQNDILTFAHLMNGSHESLRDDYEVTGIELDTLQSLLIKHGAVGARMTGAGFGGCCVALVPHHLVDSLKAAVIPAYKDKIGYEPSFYEVNAVDGTKEI